MGGGGEGVNDPGQAQSQSVGIGAPETSSRSAASPAGSWEYKERTAALSEFHLQLIALLAEETTDKAEQGDEHKSKVLTSHPKHNGTLKPLWAPRAPLDKEGPARGHGDTGSSPRGKLTLDSTSRVESSGRNSEEAE